jgi:hypothetical protein
MSDFNDSFPRPPEVQYPKSVWSPEPKKAKVEWLLASVVLWVLALLAVGGARIEATHHNWVQLGFAVLGALYASGKAAEFWTRGAR